MISETKICIVTKIYLNMNENSRISHSFFSIFQGAEDSVALELFGGLHLNLCRYIHLIFIDAERIL